MEYLKAWIFKEKKLIEQGKSSSDPVLLKYVEKLFLQMQSLVETKLIRRTKDGNFELAEIADYQVQVRELKDELRKRDFQLLCIRGGKITIDKEIERITLNAQRRKVEKIKMDNCPDRKFYTKRKNKT